MAVAVGIDLGTTNSVIAATEAGQPTVIPNAEGSRTTPSVVAFTPQGDRLVGQLARRQAILNPKGTIYSAKRFIGRRYDEVTSELTAVSFDVVPGPDNAVRFTVQGRLYGEVDVTGDEHPQRVARDGHVDRWRDGRRTGEGCRSPQPGRCGGDDGEDWCWTHRELLGARAVASMSPRSASRLCSTWVTPVVLVRAARRCY